MTDTANANSPVSSQQNGDGFDCDVCGQYHAELPRSMAFSLPDFVNKLLPWDRESRVKMSEDWCIVDDKFYYLRGCLEVPIQGSDKTFVWGVWVTISEFDFDTTMELWNDPERIDEPEYVGTIANTMPSYDETRNLKVMIKTRAVGERPAIIMDDPQHKLHLAQLHGMERARAIELAKFVLHGNANNPYGYLCER